MTRKVAVIPFVEHEAPTDRGRMAHALHLADDVRAAGAEIRLIFCGKSVEWLPQLTNGERDGEHPFVRNYGNVFDRVRAHTEACNFCCIRFGVREQVAAANIPIRGEGKDHMNLATYALDDWKIVTM